MKNMRIGRTFVALAVIGLAVTACGEAEGSATETDSATPLRVAVAPVQFETAYIAESEGYFDEHGLDVELINGADPASMQAQVVSGDVDVAMGAWMNVATSYSQGVPIQVIGGNGVVSDEMDNSGVLASPESDVQSLEDLEGRTIGVVGVNTGSDIPVLQALEAVGVDASTVSQIEIPYAGMEAALEQDTVDAVVPTDTFYHQMVEAGYPVLSNPVREYQGNMPGTVWMATEDWLSDNAETAEAFLAAMEQAVAFYEDENNIDSVKAAYAEVNQVDTSEAPDTFVPADVTINRAESQAGIDAMVHFDLMQNPVEVEDVLWDGAPLRESAADK